MATRDDANTKLRDALRALSDVHNEAFVLQQRIAAGGTVPAHLATNLASRITQNAHLAAAAVIDAARLSRLTGVQ